MPVTGPPRSSPRCSRRNRELRARRPPSRRLLPMLTRAATPGALCRKVLPRSGATDVAEGVGAFGVMGIGADHAPFHEIVAWLKPRKLDCEDVAVVTDGRRSLGEVLSA